MGETKDTERDYQAVIYSVDRWAYHGMEMPPEGMPLTKEMLNETVTEYGYIVGFYGSECSFPRGWKNFKILEISDFLPRKNIHKWVEESKERLKLPEAPRILPDLVTIVRNSDAA